MAGEANLPRVERDEKNNNIISHEGIEVLWLDRHGNEGIEKGHVREGVVSWI